MSDTPSILTDKEQLIVAVSDQIDMIICEEDHQALLNKYAPEGNPSGLIFSESYKPIIKKSSFSKTKYFILPICAKCSI